MRVSHKRLTSVTAIFTVAATLCFWSSCDHHDHEHHHHGEEEHDHVGFEEEHDHSHNHITLSLEKADAAGVEVSEVSRGTFHDVIVTSGKILAASCDETTISATASGIVHHVKHISEGMSISQGTTIYYISSDNIQDGDKARRAEIAYLSAKSEYERALPLAEEKIISAKDFSTIRTEYENARLAYEAIGSNTSGKGIAIKASTTGFMKECMVKDGDYVEVGTPLITLTRNQHLYLRAEVPVRYYSQLSKISSAKFRTQYSNEVFDLHQMNGTLLSSGKSAVSTSSYVPVTFQFDNKGDIVPGAYTEVFLITGERNNVLSVPVSSLTEEQGLYYIYVREDDHTYRKQEVSLGASDGERIEIRNGLTGGEMVVTHGAISVKLANATNAIPGHTHNH